MNEDSGREVDHASFGSTASVLRSPALIKPAASVRLIEVERKHTILRGIEKELLRRYCEMLR